MDREDIIKILTNLIKYELYHAQYERTVEIAKFAQQVFTGEDQDELIEQYKERETDEQKDQRVRLTQTMTKYASGQVFSYFRKVRRADSVKIEVDHTDDSAKERIQEAIDDFYAGKSLEAYLFDRLEQLTFLDPNAFIIAERSDERDQEGRITSTKVYPFEVPSEQARDYEYKNGLLQYLLVEQKCIEVVMNGQHKKENPVSDFLFYTAATTLKLSEYKDLQPELLPGQEAVVFEVEQGDDRTFIMEVHDTGTLEIPAIQVGAYFDTMKDSSAYVTPLEPAREIFIDLINIKSEHDLTRALHTFLQKIALAPECKFQHPVTLEVCDNGMLGEVPCGACNGSGVDLHRTTQDAIILKLTDEMASAGNLPDLSKLVFYVQMPEWLPKWQLELLDIVLRRISLAVFNTEVFMIPAFAQTATAANIEHEKIYDVLRPYATKYSDIYRHVVRITAQYLERFEGLTVEHAFPPDFKMKTVEELTLEYGNAKTAGLGAEILWGIELDILQKQYANNPDKVNKVKAKNRFKPWREKTPEEVSLILINRSQTDPDRVLYENFEKIFDDIFFVFPEFHKIPYNRQKEIVAEQVAAYTETLEGRQSNTATREQFEEEAA